MSSDRDPAEPEARQAERMRRPDPDPVLAALTELVRLKDLKDLDGENDDYRINKDRAWDEARRVIARQLKSS